MKINKSNPSLVEQEKYSIAFSPTHEAEVVKFLQMTHQKYVICESILDIIMRVENNEVDSVYLYNQEDYILDGEPMPKSAVRLFEVVCNCSGVAIFPLSEVI